MNRENPFSALHQVTETLETGIKSRFTDPFLGTFSIAFIIWNYQILLYTFSALSPDTKYALIQGSLNWKSFFGPAFATPIILLLLPRLLLKAYEFLEKNKIKLENIRHDAAMDLKTTARRIKDLEDRVREETDKTLRANNQISDKDQEIGRYKQHISQAEAKISELLATQLEDQRTIKEQQRKEQIRNEKNKLLKAEHEILSNRVKELESLTSQSSKIKNTVLESYDHLVKHNLLKMFNEIAEKSLVTTYYVDELNQSQLSKLVLFDLIALKTNDFTSRNYATLTDLGKELRKYITQHSDK